MESSVGKAPEASRSIDPSVSEKSPVRKTSWLEAILVGAITPGINAPTVAAFYIVSAALVVLLAIMLLALLSSSSALSLESIVLLAVPLLLAVGLILSVHWYLASVPLVAPEEQLRAVDAPPTKEE